MARKKRTQDAPLSEPQTRVERYLAKTAGLTDDVSQLNKPRTRLERYLAKIAGLIEEAPAAPETRLERYLDAIVQGGGGAPAGLGNALIFTSTSEFTLRKGNRQKSWDGTIEWTNGQDEWAVWDGTTTLQSFSGFLAVRGTGNSLISGNAENGRWQFDVGNGKIRCDGNIETLLDYQSVASGIHPPMADYCFAYLFYATRIISAPALPATTLSEGCYQFMFRGCIFLTNAPVLPATTLSEACYRSMFRECSGLTAAPDLPATTLATNCYNNMFQDCTNLTRAPALPATTLASRCYAEMFLRCTSLKTSPALPATTLATGCYLGMFNSCTSLKNIPALPAVTMSSNCYSSMFIYCTGVKLSSEQSGDYKYEYRIPTSGEGTSTIGSLNDMFRGTGGSFTGTPAINTTYYTDHPPVAA